MLWAALPRHHALPASHARLRRGHEGLSAAATRSPRQNRRCVVAEGV